MGKFSGNGWVKFAQMVLDHLNITKINGKELASLIGCKKHNAWRIMEELGWTKERKSPAVAYTYKRNGSRKYFSSGATGQRMFNVWLRRREPERCMEIVQ